MENQKNKENYRLISFGNLLKNTIGVFKRKWGDMFPLLILEAIPLIMYIYNNQNIFWFLLSILVSAWMNLSIIYVLKEKDRDVKFSEAVLFGWVRIGSIIWIGFLNAVAVMFGFILLIVPGIVFLVWFYFSEYILAVEDKRGVKALIRSKKLIKGKWWNIFGKILMLMLLYALILTIPLSLVAVIFGNVAFNFIFLLISIFLMAPFQIIYFYLIYEELNKKRVDQNPQQM